ncbi:MAG: hypothetical protein QXO32_03415 [Candidatus Bathyarchaeia archaeon]
MGKEEKVSRRGYVKYAAAGVVVVGVAAAGAYYATRPRPTPTPTPTLTPTPTPTPTPTVKPTPTPSPTAPPVSLKLVWYVAYPDQITEFRKLYPNVTIDAWYTDYGSMIGRLFATQGKEDDLIQHYTGTVWLMWPTGTVKSVPVSELPRWKTGNVTPIWSDPEKYFGAGISKEDSAKMAPLIKRDLWVPGKEEKEFILTPHVYNMDSGGWDPEMIPDKEIHTMGELLNREWKGKVAISDIANSAIARIANYLDYTGQLKVENVSDLKPNELTKVIDVMIEHKKAGQFKAFWPGYAYAVALHVAREIYISDVWQNGVYDVRKAGVPLYQVIADEGHDGWFSGYFIGAGTGADKLPWCYKFIDFGFSGVMTRYIGSITTYYTSTGPVSQECKDAMGPEFWGWFYGGKRTYKPITDLFPNRSERIAQALFEPEHYTWSMTSGKEDPKGNLRDGGEYFTRIGRIRCWGGFPTNAEKYTEEWSRLKAA